MEDVAASPGCHSVGVIVALTTHSLTCIYRDLDIPGKDQQVLSDKHYIRDYRSLVAHAQQLEEAELDGVSEFTQKVMAAVVYYVGILLKKTRKKRSIGMGNDPLCLFRAESFHKHITQGTTMDTPFDIDDDSDDEEVDNERMQVDLDGSDEEDDDDHDDDVEDLTEEEHREETQLLQESLFHLAIQGFTSKPTNSVDNGPLDETSILPKKEEEEELTAVKYNGRSYHKGRCYFYMGYLVGIRSFSTPNSGPKPCLPEADCVLLIPTSKTFLGTRNEDFATKILKSDYVQVRGHAKKLPLMQLADECADVDELPMWIYEPQEPGSTQTFAYTIDKRGSFRREKMKQGPPRAVELFAGAGGMTTGFKREGFETVIAVEKDAAALETFQLNHPNTTVFHGDVNEFFDQYESNPILRDQISTVDVLHASPPCQGYSAANRNGGHNDEANRELSYAFVRGTKLIRPSVGVFENVEGMWRAKHLHYLVNILTDLINLGYQFRCTVLRACHYGDPQSRPRIIIVASKVSVPLPLLPMKTHGPNNDPNLLPFVTVRDALAELEGASLADGGDGKNFPNLSGSSTGVEPGMHGVVQVDPEGLAPAVRAAGIKPVHYKFDNRCLNVRESASLQSFPTNYEFVGTISQQYRQVGNAVPIQLASAVARSLKPSLQFSYKDEGGGKQEQEEMRDEPDIIDLLSDSEDSS